MKIKYYSVLKLLVGLLAASVAVGQPAAPKAKRTAPTAPAAPIIATVPAWLPADAPAQPTATRLTDVLDTRLDLRFDYARQYVLGMAVLTLRSHFFPQSTLVLDAKGFDIKSVQLLSPKGAKTLTYKYNGRQLTVALGQACPREQTYQVRVGYVAKPNELPVGGSTAITGSKGLYFINPLNKEPGKPRQIWTQGETQSSSCWFPTIDQPNQRMTQEIALTVEDQFKTLSNGLLMASRKNPDGSRTDTWRQSLPAAPYLTMLAVGDFAIVTDSWHGKHVDYYVEPAQKELARAVFGHTPAMLEFFSKKLGVEYPWEKYSQVVVRDFVTGAMENTTATVHGTSILATRRELLDVPYDGAESTIAHELFHHWFGDYVTCESWSNLPLNESFANYAQYLWAEHRYGPDVAGLVQQQDLAHYLEEAETKREPLIRYRYANREDMFDRHTYEKGGRVLHMLRQYVGDDAFFAALNRYLTQNKLAAVEISHLRLAFEETTGEDLGWFFDQWFMQRGHPELKIKHTFANGQVQLRVRQVQDTVFQPVYRLPLSVTVWQKDRPTEYRITVSKADQTFTFLALDRPPLVKFDSESQLLAQLDEERSSDELLFQFYHARNYLQKAEVLDLLQNKTSELSVSSLLRNALNDKFYAIRRLALEHLRGYRGPNPGAVRAEVQRLATTDPSSAVRAQALSTLAAFPGESYAPVFVAALRDSSYLVEASAVAALARQPGAVARTALAALADTPSSTLLTALAGYYAQRSGLDQYDWFLRRLPDVADADLYTYLEALGRFMTQLPVVERDKGIQTLTRLARTHPQYYVRLGAYHSLATLLPSQPALKAVLADIKARETDERLKSYYNLM